MTRKIKYKPVSKELEMMVKPKILASTRQSVGLEEAVGKISLTYTQIQDRKAHKFIEQTHKNICLPKGEELGKFMFGSTIILLFNKNMMNKFAKNQGEVVKMGEKLAFGQI